VLLLMLLLLLLAAAAAAEAVMRSARCEGGFCGQFRAHQQL
jgi:hypothetical protein